MHNPRDGETAIRIDDVSKSFKLPHEKQSSIKGLFVNMFNGRRTYEKQEVLKSVSFEIKKGEFFGIVGRNGSGKSTLLKLISQIYTPDSGYITVNGKLTPFIELGVGFNPELSGRDNVYLNGALLGFSRKEMELMYDDIVEFAELEKFMDQKLKNYSSGMQVRLAFSIAIRAETDILVLDEVLAVGDEAFQRKCYQYFAKLKKDNKTVILVTHDMDSVQRFCTRAMLIDKGHMTLIGEPLEVAQRYRNLNIEKSARSKSNISSGSESDHFRVATNFKKTDKKLSFEFTVTPINKIDSDLVATFVISKSSGEVVYRFTSDEKIKERIDFTKENKFKIELDNIFPSGTFSVQIGVKKLDRSRNYALFDNIIVFELANGKGKEFWRPDEKYWLK